MNKRGSLFHWIVFAIVGAFGLFFFLANTIDVNTPSKGDWQNQFLDEIDFMMKEELLSNDELALFTSQLTIEEIAKNGGFAKDIPSTCGTINDINLWNSLGAYCFPEPIIHVNKTFNSFFSEYSFDDFTYDVTLDGFEFVGLTQNGNLTFENDSNTGFLVEVFTKPHFRVNSGYSFDEYNTLRQQATSLLNTCSNNEDLENCLVSNREDNWKFGECRFDNFENNNRKVQFCVQSEFEIYLPNDKIEPVTYLFALDFSSLKLFSPIIDSAYFSEDKLHVIFNEKSEITQYKIYVTDVIAPDFIGSPQEFRSSHAFSTQIFDEFTISLDNIISTCPFTKDTGVTYTCDGKLNYVINALGYDQERIMYTSITAIKDLEQSEIQSFTIIN